MKSIGDARSFIGKTSITPSRGFSVEILTGVTPSWKTELNRSISAVEDRTPGGLQHCHKMCCKKGGHRERQACMFWRWYYCGDVVSGRVDLHMTEEIAKIYRDEIWKLHRIPKKILSNRGLQFVSRFMEELTKALRTKRMLSTAYHPQSDGQTERINQEIEMFLQHNINYQKDDWTEWIAVAELHYNDKKHAVTRQTSFILNFGRHPWKGNLKIQI